MGKTSVACKASRQVQTMSSCEGATFWRYQGRYRRNSIAGVRAVCSTNHSVRAATRTNRNVLAPTTRSRLRHWSWPNPAKALLSRMVISTAHRSRYWARRTSRLNVRSVVKKASTRGRGYAGQAGGLEAAADGALLSPESVAPAARYATALSTPERASQLRWSDIASPTVCAPRFSATPILPLSSVDTPGTELSGGAVVYTACPG